MEERKLNPLTQLPDLDSLWNPVNPQASETALSALMPSAQLPILQDRSYWIELLALIARAQSLQGKVIEARDSLKKAETLLSEEHAVYSVAARIRWLIEKGRLFILEKTPSQARIVFSEAWSLAIHSGEDYFIVDVAQMMAVIEPPKSQQEWIVRAIDIAEKSLIPKTMRCLGSLYTALGWKLYDLRQFDKALEIFQKALKHLKTQGTEREAFVAQWSTGKVLRALGKTEEALAIQKVLLAELGIGGIRDGRLYEEIAECLQSLKRSSEAQLYFELAYRELSSDVWTLDNQPLKLKRMKDLGKVK